MAIMINAGDIVSSVTIISNEKPQEGGFTTVDFTGVEVVLDFTTTTSTPIIIDIDN